MSTTVVKCFFCNENESKYSCPQCLLKYCSVACYQHPKHLKCSENFYKDQVTTELKQLNATPDEKKQLIDYLVKNSNVERDTNRLTDRFDNIDLDDSTKLWEALTQDEKEVFQRKIESGDLDFVDQWEPWWLNDENKHSKSKSYQPKTMQKIPTIESLLRKKEPNIHMKNSVIEILFAYSCVNRLYNGDLYDSAEECIDTLLSLSNVLRTNRVYDDTLQMLHICSEKVECDENINVTSLSCIADVISILEYKDGTVKAMSDLYRYFKRCCKHFKRENYELSKKCYNLEKRFLFFVSYVNEYMLVNSSLLEILKSFYQMKSSENEDFEEEANSVKTFLSTCKKKSNLIEELT